MLDRPDRAVLDRIALDRAELDPTVLNPTVLDRAVLGPTVLDRAVLNRAVLDPDPSLLYLLPPELARTSRAGREAAPAPDVRVTDARTRTNPEPALPLLA